MQKVKHVPPFYDESSAPPAFSSLLTDQPELFGSNTHHSPNLLTVQIIPPQSKSVVQIRIALTEQPALPKMGASLPSKQGRHAARSPYPTTKQERQHCQARARSHDRADSESPSEDLSSSLDSTSDSESTLSEEPPKIPKPAGEPGRPGRGGYNLKCALDWDNNVYTKFKRFTHKLIDEHLDTTKCSRASAQDKTLLKVVRDKAMGAFPDLDDYSKCWPVTDLIMMRLKYTSSRARLRESAEKARRSPTALE